MRLRTLLPIPMLLVALVACRDPDAPRPVNVLPTHTPTPGRAAPSGSAPSRPLSTRDEPARDVRPVAPTPRPAQALPPGVPDPAEPGISGLARVARYVFREMRLAEPDCPFANPLHDPLSFVFHIEVRDGRMVEVHLSRAGRHTGQQIEPLSAVPPELAAYAACLTPRLEAVVMAPPPPDGAYQPEYSYPGHAGGR